MLECLLEVEMWNRQEDNKCILENVNQVLFLVIFSLSTNWYMKSTPVVQHLMSSTAQHCNLLPHVTFVPLPESILWLSAYTIAWHASNIAWQLCTWSASPLFLLNTTLLHTSIFLSTYSNLHKLYAVLCELCCSDHWHFTHELVSFMHSHWVLPIVSVKADLLLLFVQLISTATQHKTMDMKPSHLSIMIW